MLIYKLEFGHMLSLRHVEVRSKITVSRKKQMTEVKADGMDEASEAERSPDCVGLRSWLPFHQVSAAESRASEIASELRKQAGRFCQHRLSNHFSSSTCLFVVLR